MFTDRLVRAVKLPVVPQLRLPLGELEVGATAERRQEIGLRIVELVRQVLTVGKAGADDVPEMGVPLRWTCRFDVPDARVRFPARWKSQGTWAFLGGY